MLLSMTGYGKGRAQTGQWLAVAEIKSINSRYLDVSLKLPRHYAAQELWVRGRLAQEAQRGKISVTLTVQNLNTGSEPAVAELDVAQLKTYAQQWAAVRAALGLPPDPPPVAALLALPGAVREADPEVDEAEWAAAQQAFDLALKNLNESRAQEGQALAQDMAARAQLIRAELATLPELAQERQLAVRLRITQALADLQLSTPDRLEQEMIFYLERNDITEEMVRLKQHLDLMDQTLNGTESQGRRLNFLTQEIGRELNTLGVKAYHAGIQAKVVNMKDWLEQIKEQLANVL